MGKKSPKQEITDYHLSLHLGVCTAPAVLVGLQIGEKPVWSGHAAEMQEITLSKRDLFGGAKKEGGIAGTVTWLPGAWDQVLPDGLAQRMGRSSGADCPGFRGLGSLFFTDGGNGQRGFYWTSNSPYLRDIWPTVLCTPTVLNPDYALIPNADANSAYTEVQVVDLNSVSNGAANNTAGLSAGVTLSGFSPLTTLRLSLPPGQTYTAWSPWGVPSPANPAGHTGSSTKFYVIRDGDVDDFIQTPGTISDGYEAARAAFEPILISGAEEYTFYLQDSPSSDNTGGLSILVEALGSERYDANPAHMIYECLVDQGWGMGAPPGIIDYDSFDEASQTLYGEGLGLSLIWTRQDTIENFVNEILDHIQATIFVNPRTGLITLKLIRADYDPETLRVLTPDNARLSNFQRKAWGEITNEIIGTWTNPQNEQEETVTLQDLVGIAIQGTPVSDGRNYYGARSVLLATQLITRDLRAAAYPLASLDVEIDRSEWDLLPGDVRKITWPEHGLYDVVFRVGPVDYGRPGDSSVKASLTEDVFGLPIGDYNAPPTSGWIDTSTEPEAMDPARIITLPAFIASGIVSEAGGVAPTYPEVLAGVLASSDVDDTLSYDVLGTTVKPDGSSVQEVQSTNTVLGYATLVDALVPEAESTDVTFADFIGKVFPAATVFVLIGGDETPETEMEIAMIVAADAGAYTLARGLLDTVPRDWPADTPVWFLNGDATVSELDFKADGETIDYKLLSRTSLGALSPDDAPTVSGTLSGRPHFPNRPANVTAFGEAWSSEASPIDVSSRSDPWVTTTWANRNRLLEDSQVMLWDDATMAPEDGQTTRIEVLAADGTALATHDGLSGTSFDVPDASFAGKTIARLQFYSDRSDADGDFTSLQFFEHWIQTGLPTFDNDTFTFDNDTLTWDQQ